ncbi:carbamoyltransferase HypF [Thalassovita aquimarina]|uniref:Carbamoyltransferase HypF n=1 Tax=Thalassovita aquimarina TaxID=2785917 RepID=A0ABS5HKU3_9RHOB|nr:carbamoyltransferase HypF [Thalassovita aquimarina]
MTVRRIRVRGQVQGVGFRPFVWRLARRMGLRGRVLNDAEGVLICVAGPGLDRFEASIRAEAPGLARIDAVESEGFDFDPPAAFEIVASQGQGAETGVTPDAATCSACLAEIRDPGDRRFGYAFANCTCCGPRFTILEALPYDRAQTSMSAFDLCPDCGAEYADPGDRRFHAQPVACPDCGPRPWLEAGGRELPGDPLALAAEKLARGEVLAIKGLGGFHLCVDACQPQAVALLRRRKRRPGKPLALMGDAEMIARHASVSEAEWDLLRDPAAPIVLLEKAGEALPEAVAPGLDRLGWMLPHTPLHHLLIDATGRPLVMTSGNLSGEPQASGNDEARQKLSGYADAFLMHDRGIVRRLDDSVERIAAPGAMVLRRGRGRVPGTLLLPDGFGDAPRVVGYGGQMKAAICLVKNGRALLGHHLGDLDAALSWGAFLQADRDYAGLFDFRPDRIACDLHPDFSASRHAAARAAAVGVPLTPVQHHHAHLAACLGDNLWPLDGGKVAGIVLDGLGLGPDGTLWGGEVLLGDYHGFDRRFWLRPAPLIGGDRAQAEPWRNALARLDQAGLGEWADRLFPEAPLGLGRQAARAGINAPLSSSAGRLFDAVAACLGICPMGQSYEGEAAMRLEAIACRAPDTGGGFGFSHEGPVIDPAPIWAELFELRSKGAPAQALARQFHAGLARAFAGAARGLVESGQARAVALSGGCFQNALLLELVLRELGDLPVLIHRKIPANDGGLAFGQALVAAAKAAP